MAKEKTKIMKMFDAKTDTIPEDYYDEQERKEVEFIQWKWDYLTRYELLFDDGFENDLDEDDFDEQEEERKIQRIADRNTDILHEFRDTIVEYRKNAISMKAIDEYNNILFNVNDSLCEVDDWHDDFVIDPKHIAELKEKRREEARKHRLKELADERQRYIDAIQESESLIEILKERNASPVVIDDEQALIEKNKEAIKDLDSQIEALQT